MFCNTAALENLNKIYKWRLLLKILLLSGILVPIKAYPTTIQLLSAQTNLVRRPFNLSGWQIFLWKSSPRWITFGTQIKKLNAKFSSGYFNWLYTSTYYLCIKKESESKTWLTFNSFHFAETSAYSTFHFLSFSANNIYAESNASWHFSGYWKTADCAFVQNLSISL